MAKQPIPQASYAVNNVRLLPDQVKGDAPFVKETFDKGVEDGRTYINGTLIPALNGNTGSNMIGLSNVNLSSDNVGDGIEEIRLIAVQAQAGELLPNSVTNTILGTDVKVGSLAELSTTDKTSVTNALNEVNGGLGDVVSDVSILTTDLDTAESSLEILRKFNVTTGSNVALAVDTFGTFDLTKTGNILNILPNVTNTGAMTINPDGQGAKSIKKFNVDTDAYVDIEASDIKKNTPTSLAWDLANNFFVYAPKSGGSNIKSIQRGITTILSGQNERFVTITAVDLNVALPKHTFFITTGTVSNEIIIQCELVNSTTLKFSRRSTPAFASQNINWTVVEYKNVKSIQNGTKAVSVASTEQTQSITSVDISKSELQVSYNHEGSTSTYNAMALNSRLISSTSIGFQIGDVANGGANARWYLIEFK